VGSWEIESRFHGGARTREAGRSNRDFTATCCWEFEPKTRGEEILECRIADLLRREFF
jgi:hypothetical protein